MLHLLVLSWLTANNFENRHFQMNIKSESTCRFKTILIMEQPPLSFIQLFHIERKIKKKKEAKKNV